MIKTHLIALAFLSVAACAPVKPVPVPPPTVVVTGCEHFRLLTASRKDTTETKTEILGHNTEYLKVCGRAK